MTETGEPKQTSQLLDEAIAAFEGDSVPLGALLDALAERAFGMVLLVLALPCAIPFLYGVPQIMSLPMVFVAVQLAAGRHTLWLPESLRRRTIGKANLTDMMDKARPWLRRFERISRPRLGFLTKSPMEQVVGLLFVLFSLTIMIPLPATNTVPGIAIAVASLGFIERDGVLVVLGSLLGIAWTLFLVSVAGGAVALISDAVNAIGA
ncbi:exopolysaccharide biosynthesis protein [Pyruvatibacter mobilis]|jgi:hypothetical protein|uniref:exopolysaccharide biosynthesis protein n=1 Tax=Pyruvatibacter mobilis TaxID=1712261 RepID=UPI003BAC4064